MPGHLGIDPLRRRASRAGCCPPSSSPPDSTWRPTPSACRWDSPWPRRSGDDLRGGAGLLARAPHLPAHPLRASAPADAAALFQPFLALALTALATALTGATLRPVHRRLLAPVLAFGGLWHAGAAMGTVALGVVDSVVRRLVGSFRARLVWVTFVLVLGGYVLATAVGLGAVELYTAALAEPDSVSQLVLRLDSTAPGHLHAGHHRPLSAAALGQPLRPGRSPRPARGHQRLRQARRHRAGGRPSPLRRLPAGGPRGARRARAGGGQRGVRAARRRLQRDGRGAGARRSGWSAPSAPT